GYAVFSANNLGREFVVDRDELNRSTFMFKGGKKVGRWSVDGNVQYITSKIGTTSATLYTELLQAATNIPIERFSAPKNEHHWTSYYRSPYWMRDNIRNQTKEDNVRMIGTLNYKLDDHINFNYLVSASIGDSQGLSYTNEYIDLIQVGGGDHTTLSS